MSTESSTDRSRPTNTGTSGVTLLEVIIVVALFSVILLVVFVSMQTSAMIEKQQEASSRMQTSLEGGLDDIRSHLKEGFRGFEAIPQVDTQMRWRNDDIWEGYDKFHTLLYREFPGENFRAPGVAQCPNPDCGWSVENGNPRMPNFAFASNYNYSDDGVFYTQLQNRTTNTGNAGTSQAGRIYNNYYSDDRSSYLDQFQGSQNYAQYPENLQLDVDCQFCGTPLNPVVQYDVMKFPSPLNTFGGADAEDGTDFISSITSFVLYAPYYDENTTGVELRRFHLFHRDLLEDIPHDSGADNNPLYEPGDAPSGETIRPAVADAAYRDRSPMGPSSGGGSHGFRSWDNYNQLLHEGTPPPSFGNADVPFFMPDLFDFDGDGLIENILTIDPSTGIKMESDTTEGEATPDSEARYEQFRLYPSVAPSNAGGGPLFNDWAQNGPDDVKGLIFYKHEDRAAELKDGLQEAELYLFVDLESGWTRFYYSCDWANTDTGNSGTFSINAAFVRRLNGPLDDSQYEHAQDYNQSVYMVPFESLTKGLVGMNFNTTWTYPEGQTEGLSDPMAGYVRIGLLSDQRVQQQGDINFPSERVFTEMTPLQIRDPME